MLRFRQRPGVLTRYSNSPLQYRISDGLVVVANNTNFCDHLSSYTGANWIFRSITRHKAGSAGYTNVQPVFSNSVGGITTELVIAHTFRIEAWIWSDSTSPVKLTFNGGATYCEFTGGVSSQARADAPVGFNIVAGENVYVKTLAYATDSGAAGTYTWYGNIRVSKLTDSTAGTANAFLADETPGAAGAPYGGKLGRTVYDSPTTGVASIAVTAQGQGYNTTAQYSVWYGVTGATVPGAQYKGVSPSGGGFVSVSANKLSSVTIGSSKGWAHDSANMPYAYAGYTDYFGLGPIAIFGTPNVPAYSPIIFGDSWTAGNSNDPTGLGTIYETVLGQPVTRVATNGNSLYGFLNNQSNIRARIQEWAGWGVKFSHVICAHGVNDFRLYPFSPDYGPTLKSSVASFKTWAQTYFGTAFRFGIITVPPSTTSTDGWSSLANQTPYTYSAADQYRANGPVINYNADVRSANGISRDFYIDLAAKVSDPSYPHLWRVDCYDTVGSAAVMCSDTQNAATDSVTFGTGSKTFTVGTNKLYSTSQYVEITDGVSGNKMRGNVTGYNNSTGVLTVNVTYNGGSGTSTSWTVKAIGRTTTDGIHLGGSGYQWAIDNRLLELIGSARIS